MKKYIAMMVVMLVAVSVTAKWNLIHDETGNQIMSYFESEDRAVVGTKFALHSYTNESEAFAKAQALIASGAKLYDGVTISTPTNSANMQSYIYEDTFLLICDQLSSSTNHIKLPMESLSMILLQIKAADKPKYENLRDGLSMLNASLTRENVRWWDTIVWHAEPEVVTGAIQLLNLMQ